MAEFMFPNVVYRATVYRTGYYISRSQSENWVKKIQAAAYNGACTVAYITSPAYKNSVSRGLTVFFGQK